MKEQSEQAKTRARQRLRKKIKEIIFKYGYKVLFLTLTFSDDVLNTTTEEQRERIVKNYLKENTALYIANKDYGAKKGREHYHALILADTLTQKDLKHNEDLIRIYGKIDLNGFKGGRLNARPIKRRELIKYDLDTLTEHFTSHYFKETTKGARIIYSRGIESKQDQIKRLKRRLKEIENTEKLRLEKAEQEQPKPLTDKEILNDALSDYEDFIKKTKNGLFNNIWR